jgi:hypothetical protein
MILSICDVLIFCANILCCFVCPFRCMFCICSTGSARLRYVSNIAVVIVHLHKNNKLLYESVCISTLL